MEETISLEYYYTTLPGSPELHTPYFPRPLHWHRRGRRRPGIYGGGPGPTLCLVSNGTVQRPRASGDAPRSGPVQSPTSIAESRLTGARHSLRSKGERGRLRQVAVDDESLDLGRAVAFKLSWARAVRFSRAGRRSAPVVCR